MTSEQIAGDDSYAHARLLWNGRWKLLLFSAIAGGLAAVWSLLTPPTYEAVSTLIPPVTPDRFSQLSQFSANLELGVLAGPPPGKLTLLYPDIIRSRRLLQSLLALTSPTLDYSGHRTLLSIMQPTGTDPRRTEIAVRKLRRQITATLDRRTGLLTVRVKARHPALAAWISNSLDSLLQRFVVEFSTSQAGKTARFVEDRLSEASAQLELAEDRLRTFRERNLRIGNSPRLLLEEGRLARNLRVQEEIYITLKRQYEIAKIEEQRDVPLITVLDRARPSVFRVWPRRTSMTLWGTVAGAVLGYLYLLLAVRTDSHEPSGV